MDKRIDYRFFHWGPFLYKTSLDKDELSKIKSLCNKSTKDYRKHLAGIIKHEYKLDHVKLFKIINIYIRSYCQAFFEYRGKGLGNKIELMSAWVNYMTKFESNPIHTHDEDVSFVIFTQIPKDLKQEAVEYLGRSGGPGTINFLYCINEREEFLNEHSFFPEVGDMFIFPSKLSHYVNGFKCEGERISISGNFKISNTDGEKNI
tara:strand:+ start:34 stop:645 length:612 start_codon:yes stop_codon:yes gene_type:complete